METRIKKLIVELQQTLTLEEVRYFNFVLNLGLGETYGEWYTEETETLIQSIKGGLSKYIDSRDRQLTEMGSKVE